MDNRLMISFIVVKNRMNKCELLSVSLLGPNSFCIFSFRGKVWSDLSILARYMWTKGWKTRLHFEIEACWRYNKRPAKLNYYNLIFLMRKKLFALGPAANAVHTTLDMCSRLGVSVAILAISF